MRSASIHPDEYPLNLIPEHDEDDSPFQEGLAVGAHDRQRDAVVATAGKDRGSRREYFGRNLLRLIQMVSEVSVMG